jgi:hypothetical protein
LRINIAYLITTPIFATILALIAAGAGAFLSHWYITAQQGGSASLLSHSTLMAKVWVPVTLIFGLVGVLISLFNTYTVTVISLLNSLTFSLDGMGWILTIVCAAIAGYSMYLMVKGMQKLYPAVKDNQRWITAAIMVFVTALIFAI